MSWYNSSWLYRKKITVDNTKVSGSSSLTDFPIYLDLSELGSDFFSNVKSGGGDIRITESDGTTEVPREIVSCDTTGETGEVHFKGTLSHNTDTEFYIYYGNSGASDYAINATYGAENVWSSDYKAVYHLEDANDSTSNSNDGTVSGATSGATGQIGDAYDFDGNNDYIYTTNQLSNPNVFTLSAWIKTTVASGNKILGFENRRTGTSSNSYDVHLWMGTDGKIYFGIWVSGTRIIATSSTYNDGNLHKITGTLDASGNMKLYVDGSLINTLTSVSPTISPVYLRLGSYKLAGWTSALDGYFDGIIDEVRMMIGTAITADYEATEYNNQNSASTFYTIGSQEVETISVTVGPSQFDGTFTLNNPVITAIKNVLITPDPLTLTGTVNDPTISIDESNLVSPAIGTFTLNNPTILAGPEPEPEAGRISVYINNIRVDNITLESLKVDKVIDNQRDSASFKMRKGVITPEFLDIVKVYDGLDVIFAGVVVDVDYDNQTVEEKGIMMSVKASDFGYILEKRLIGKTYENETIHNIIADMLSTNAPLFNADNASVGIEVDKIVFNQVPISQAIQRLADLLNYRWFVDTNRSIHFFEKTEKLAPENLTDTSGNYVYRSLKRKATGSQLINRIKIRGGEYDGDTYTDSITVTGNVSKSFNLPYKLSDLTVKVNTVVQTVGIDFINDFTSYDVLYNYQNQSFRFDTALSNGDVIEFSGKPKIRVFAIAEDSDSVNAYGIQEKLIRENDIKSNEIARKRASAELLAFAQPLVDASFFTYNKFLEVGMNIKIKSDNSGADDSLLISKISYQLIDPFTFGYKIDCVSNKRYDLITTLSRLLQPDDLDINESETSEEIYADNAEIEVEEDIEVVNPFEDFESVEIQEDILQDPFTPDSIEWVFGYYFPTSDSDPKRMAKFDRDATFS